MKETAESYRTRIRAARRFLEQRGLTVAESGYGGFDLVAADGDEIVLVAVVPWGPGRVDVGACRRAMESYVAESPGEAGKVRVDVVSVNAPEGSRHAVCRRHIGVVSDVERKE